jgi:hypothetical protein
MITNSLRRHLINYHLKKNINKLLNILDHYEKKNHMNEFVEEVHVFFFLPVSFSELFFFFFLLIKK